MRTKTFVITLLSTFLAIVFCLFFMYAKHHTPYAQIIPFANDPYDAIGTFTFLLSPFLLILGYARLIQRLIKNDFPPEGNLFFARTLAAIPLSVLLVLCSNSIAMVRYMHSWIHSSVWLNLLGFLAGIALLAVFVLIVIQNSLYISRPSTVADYKRALIILIPYTFILAIYPNSMVHSPMGELIRLAISIVLFFVSLAQLLPVVIRSNEPPAATLGYVSKSSKYWLNWLLVIFVGLAVGIFVLYGESAENNHDGHRSLVPALMMVTFVYVGTTTLSAITAYLTLRKPLGLFPSKK